MKAPKPDIYNELCPSRDVLELVSGKWSMLLICSLRRGPIRTGALKRSIGGISQKMLTQTLRELERSGLVRRISYDEVPPRVEYALTSLGESLSELIRELDGWIVRNFKHITSRQRAYDLSSIGT